MNKKITTLLVATTILTTAGCLQKDTEAPEITVYNKVVTAGTKVDKDSLYSVKDNIDENPTVTIDGDLDTSVAGTYSLTVEAKDKAGNKSEKIVKVVVKGEKTDKTSNNEDAETGSEESESKTSSSASSDNSSTTASDNNEQSGNVVVEATGGTSATSKYSTPIDTTESDSEKATSTKTADNEDEVKKFIESAKADPSQFLSSGSSLLDDGSSEHAVIAANGHSASDSWTFVNDYFKNNPKDVDVDLYELYYYADGTSYGWRSSGDADHFVGIVVCGTSDVPTSVS